jgi:hypothetical protein
MAEENPYDVAFGGEDDLNQPHMDRNESDDYNNHVEEELSEDNPGEDEETNGDAAHLPHLWSLYDTPRGWIPFGGKITIELDSADATMLKQGKAEMQELIQRWVHFAFGRNTTKKYTDLTLEKIASMWLGTVLIRDMQTDINVVLGSENQVMDREFRDYLQVSLLLMFYSESAEGYFHHRGEAYYMSKMEKKRYFEIYNALNGSALEHRTHVKDGDMWSNTAEVDPKVLQYYDALRRSGRDYGFTSFTLISNDDDMLAARSKDQ